MFVASCAIGACDCNTHFVSKITGVEIYDEPGRLRVHITSEVTPDEVFVDMVASGPHIGLPQS